MRAKHFQNGADSCACGQPWPHSKKSTKKKLTKVYKVIEDEPPDNKPHTWKLVEIPIASASDKMIIVARMVASLGYRTRFQPHALGRLFHATPASAVIHFLKLQNQATDAASRALKEAARALEWVKAEFQQYLDGDADEITVAKEHTDG